MQFSHNSSQMTLVLSEVNTL